MFTGSVLSSGRSGSYFYNAEEGRLTRPVTPPSFSKHQVIRVRKHDHKKEKHALAGGR